MLKQSGNFLLQALLALTLVFAFIPFFASRIYSRDLSAQIYATTNQVETLYTAARIYLRENREDLPYKKTELFSNELIDTLESYGLPLGFIPKTSLGQDISFVIDKNEDGINGTIRLVGGKLSRLQLAELVRRIGFYAKLIDGDIVEVSVPIDNMYNDIVAKKETNENIGFLTELSLGDNKIDGINVLFSRNGNFETSSFSNLNVYGLESGRSEKNSILSLNADRTVFQSADGESALSLSKGTLNVNNASLRTISKFGNVGSFESNTASVYEFSLSEGHTSFIGPSIWNVSGNLQADNFSFSVDVLNVGSYLDASKGQDVYIDTDSLTYNSSSGIDVDTISASNITLREQTSYGLLNGDSGSILIDIRPAGTSVLPDAYVNDINNDSFKIIYNPKDTEGRTVSCEDIIATVGGNYNSASLAQNIICQYVFWQRLERRIDIKQCLLDGRNDCM